jgi:predicted DNA-binding transcriptional regulator YafY
LIDKTRLRLLYLMRILQEETDEAHPLSIPQIIGMLKGYGIHADRRAIYNDLEALRTYGLDIIYQKGKHHNYYIGNRIFELPELKLLADIVQSSRFMTRKKSEQLIEKLQHLTSRHHAKELSRQVYIANRVKSPNEQIYYNVDVLHSAIGSGKQVAFQYQEYGLDKKLHLRRAGEAYHVSPYLLTWDYDNYYLIAWHTRYDGLAHFRVDKMSGIEITAENCRPMERALDAAEYAKSTFGMFAGKQERVNIRFDVSLIGKVIDRFGDQVSMAQNDETSFTCAVEIAVSAPFFAWLFQFGDMARIVSPDWVKQEMHSLLVKTLQGYQ